MIIVNLIGCDARTLIHNWSFMFVDSSFTLSTTLTYVYCLTIFTTYLLHTWLFILLTVIYYYNSLSKLYLFTCIDVHFTLFILFESNKTAGIQKRLSKCTFFKSYVILVSVINTFKKTILFLIRTSSEMPHSGFVFVIPHTSLKYCSIKFQFTTKLTTNVYIAD